MDCLRSVSKAFANFSKFIMPIGFGARTTLKGDGPACNLFSMTGDFDDPFIENSDEVVKCYQGTLKSVKLALPVLYKSVLEFVCDVARSDLEGS